MIREVAQTMWQVRRAPHRYPPPPDMLEKGSVLCEVEASDGLASHLRHIYATHNHNPYAVRRAVDAAGMVGGLVLLSARNGLRTYLYDDNKLAHELPVLPLAPPSDGYQNAVKLRQSPRTWSITEMLRQEAGVEPGLTIEYGFSLLKAINAYPDLSFGAADHVGNISLIDLSVPPAGLLHPPEGV